MFIPGGSSIPTVLTLNTGAVRPTTVRAADGRIRFENGRYRINVGERGEIGIFNKETQEAYSISGEAEVTVDEEETFQFWGRTSFVLDDDTKLTIETSPQGDDVLTVSTSDLTITYGDYGVHISGLDEDVSGSLQFSETENFGALMDVVVRDGNTIAENSDGVGFVSTNDDGEMTPVDQELIDQTDEMMADELAKHLTRLLGYVSGIQTIRFTGSFLADWSDSTNSNNQKTTRETRMMLVEMNREPRWSRLAQ